MGPLVSSSVLIVVVLLSTIDYATLQTMPTTTGTTSPRIEASESRMSTSVENITTITTELFAATTGKMESKIGTTGSGMTPDVTTLKQNMITITPATTSSTHNMVPTTQNNQSVIQRLGSTTVPLSVFIDNGKSLLRSLGSDATLICSASGSGTIKVVWIGPFGNTLTNNTKYTVTSFNINTGKSTLTIFALSTTDNGTYTCLGTDESRSTAQDSTTLTVYGTTGSGMTPDLTTLKQNMITITPATTSSTHNMVPTTQNNQSVIQRLGSTTVPLSVSIDNGKSLLRSLGSDATLICSASGSGTIKVVWIGPFGNTLTNNTKYTVTSFNINTGKSTLTIFALSTTDNGTYTCLGTDESRSTAQDSTTLTVYGTTGSGMTPDVTTLKQNMITITPATTSSTHNMVPTTQNNQSVIQRLGSTTVPLSVFIDNGKSLLRSLGSDATLICSASGSGTIKVVWIGPFGNTLTNNTKYTVTSFNINTGKSTLTIFALSTTDNGTYTCLGTGESRSTAQDSTTLTVYGTTGSGMTPDVTTLKQNMITITPATTSSTHNMVPTTQNNQSVIQRLGSTTVPLSVFIDNGKSLLRSLGSDATLICSASGSGTIKVVWIGPFGNTLTNNTKYTVTSFNINTGKSTLTIFALSTTDNGTYTCLGTDESRSTAQDSTTLTVYGTTGSGMTPDVTTLKQKMITITPATTTSTHNMAPTAQNNQSVIQRLGSTTDTSGSGMATEMTTAKQNMITTAPEISTQNVVSTTPNNQTVIKRLDSTTVPLTVSIDDGETMFRQSGSDATITCSASGVGNITVAWIGPARNTLTNNAKYTVTSFNTNTGKSTLTIYALSTTDTGSYICLAMAGSRSAYDSITLKLYDTSGSGMATEMTTAKQNMITIAPEISTQNVVSTTPNNQTVIKRLDSTTVPLTVSIDDGETMFRQSGSDATITCSASGVGNITVVWIGPARNTLTNNAKYTVTSFNINTGKSTLTIYAFSTTDTGSYICLAMAGSRSAYDSITLKLYEGTTGAGMTSGMETSKQNIITTTPGISTAADNKMPTIPSNQTVIQRLVSTTTPEASSATPIMMPTIPSNQTVIQRLVSTTTPEASSATPIMMPTIPSNQTVIKRLVSTTTPEASSATPIMMPTIPSSQTVIQRLVSTTTPEASSATPIMMSTIPSNQTVIQRLVSTTTPEASSATPTMMSTIPSSQTVIQRLVSTAGETMPEVTSLPHNVTLPSPLMSNSTQEMTASWLANTSASLRGFDATTATAPQNIPAAEQISKTSMNSTTPLPIGTTKHETISTTGIREQSDNCCFNENMVIMLQHNVPVVNGYIPFVSILEQTNGTNIAVCDAKVLLKATFRRSNQTAPCESCTNIPKCGNQMLKIDLWMSPSKHGVSFHAGDSITNNEYGGDNNTQENDAEFHMYNYEQRLYGSDKCLNMSQLLFRLPNASVHWVSIYIGNEFIRVSTPLGDAYELCSNCLFALNGQSDSQGTVNEDIYIGLNRIIRSSHLGDGSGVCGVVISWACPWKT